MIAVIPLFDLLSTIWPLQPGNLPWRYGVLGLLGNFILTPLLGAVLAAAAASELRHVVALRVFSILYILLAVVLAAALALFALDVLQLRGQLNGQNVPTYQRTAVTAAAKYLAGMLALIWLGVAGLRTARNLRAGSGRTG